MTRFLHLPAPEEPLDEDPMAGVANLFDVSVVFIVGLMITLFSGYRFGDLMDPESEVTLVKTNSEGLREVIVKKGNKITAYELTGETLGGEEMGPPFNMLYGTRLVRLCCKMCKKGFREDPAGCVNKSWVTGPR